MTLLDKLASAAYVLRQQGCELLAEACLEARKQLIMENVALVTDEMAELPYVLSNN